MNETPQKDYFEYRDGEIIYKQNPSRQNAVNSPNMASLQLSNVLSIFLHKSSSLFYRNSKKIIFICLGILCCFTLFVGYVYFSSAPYNPYNAISSQDKYALNTLRTIETAEFSDVENYITSKTSSLYVKKSIPGYISEKEALLELGGFSVEIESSIKNSISHSVSILEALNNYNFSLVETLHNHYFKKQ